MIAEFGHAVLTGHKGLFEMKATTIKGATRNFGKPADWDKLTDVPCGTLPVRDEVDDETGLPFMYSQWKPDAAELDALNGGGVIRLGINGTVHPVVNMQVVILDDAPPAVTYIVEGIRPRTGAGRPVRLRHGAIFPRGLGGQDIEAIHQLMTPLIDEINVLRAALAPFGKAGDKADEKNEETRRCGFQPLSANATPGLGIKFGDCWHARDVLAAPSSFTVVEYAAQDEADDPPEKCTRCAGHGEYDDAHGKPLTCSWCNGTGEVR